MQEPELIGGLKNGEESAFRHLVQSYGDRVFNSMISFVQQTEDAEELTQDVFIKVFRSINKFEGASSLSTWIYRIAVTTALDFLRRKKRRQRTSLSFLFRNGAAGEPVTFYHPGISAEQKESSALLFQAIGKLPEQQQAAFLLQKAEALSQSEIAAILDTSVSAVESLLHRAKANLRKELSGHFKNKDYGQ